MCDTIYSKNCLYVYTPGLSEDQLRAIFRKLIEDCENAIIEINPKYIPNCRFYINSPRKRDGQSMGYSYVWLSRCEVHNVCLGRNPDGSDRVEHIPDPNAKPTEAVYDSWADYPICKTIERNLPSLVTIPTVETENGPQQLKFSCSYADEIDTSMLQHNVLYCKTPVPSWISESDLVKLFGVYSTGKISVDFTKGRNAFITFPTQSDDAYFALQMLKVHTYVKGSNQVVLLFEHARVTRQRRGR